MQRERAPDAAIGTDGVCVRLCGLVPGAGLAHLVFAPEHQRAGGADPDTIATIHARRIRAKRFLTKAIRRHGVPEKITIDGSAANEAAIKSYNEEHGTAIEIRKIKYLNNIVEQDHRGIKRVTRPMLGFKSFDAAQGTLVGIELMHMIKKRQMVIEAGDEGLTAAEQFYQKLG